MIAETEARAADRAVAGEFARRVAERLGAALSAVYFYGSRARGTPAPWSDYDLLVVLKEKDSNAEDAVHEVSMGLLMERGWDLSPKVYGRARFDAGVRARQPFLMGIADEGIQVWSANKKS